MRDKLAKARVAAIAAIVMVAGVLLTVMVSGTAEAQSGSRICGNFWVANPTSGGHVQEVIWVRVLEVHKDDGVTCTHAIDKANRLGNPPVKANNWGDRQRLHNVTCEYVSQQLLDSKYGDDICNRMQRVDNAFQLSGRTISEFHKIYN
jgi:hypothetical protein